MGEETFAAAGESFSQPIIIIIIIIIKKRLESFADSLFISDFLFRVWPDKNLVNGGH